LHRLGAVTEQGFDQLRQKLGDRLGSGRPIYIQPYRWYGSATELALRGRVLRENGLRTADDDDTWWDNLLNSYRRFNSNEVPYAKLMTAVAGEMVRFSADDEGYFDLSLPASPASSGWQTVTVLLDSDDAAQPEPISADVPILVPAPSAQFGVISDIDDTVVRSFANEWLKVARVTFLHNARLRLPFPGVAAFYRALQQGTADGVTNPIFYVSSSPWNLYDLLSDFMAHQQIPAGPLCLRDVGIDNDKFISSGHHEHKWEQITGILDTYPHMRFILIGDSGQEDPEIYEEVVRHYPDRIAAIYIRDVSLEARQAEVRALAAALRPQQVEMRLVADSLTAARHAAASGFIRAEALDGISAETATDEAAPDAIEQLLDEL
jgi:phosphatidate phosphatase APP1